jgi:hypothetical protein
MVEVTEEEVEMELRAIKELKELRKDSIADIWFLVEGEVLKREDLEHLRKGKAIKTV